MILKMKIFYRESCGCCWHINLMLFGFGKKDGIFYVDILTKTIWLI